MAKSRIRRGNRVYVYERENYRTKDGKVKHRNPRYLGIEVIENGKKIIIPPKRRFKNFEITKSVRYGDIAVIYEIFKEYGLIDLLNGLVPRRGLPIGEVFSSLAINHIVDRETLNKFSKWYNETTLEDLTDIDPDKLNSTNLGAVMSTFGNIGPEGIVDVCLELFDKIKHLEPEKSSLIYDITSTFFYTMKLPKVRLGYNRDKNSYPQINISLVVTKGKGLPILFRTYEGNVTDVKTINQLIIDVKRVNIDIDSIILDRGMASKDNLIKLTNKHLKIIGGIPLTSNEAKELVRYEITEENEIFRPSSLIYYEDIPTSLFGIEGRAIVCFNHTDLERERTTRLKKLRTADRRVAEILKEYKNNDNIGSLEMEIKAVIKGVTNYFEMNNDEGKFTIEPNNEARKNARLQDGKCLIFTTNSEKSASEIISTYFEKDEIEKIFHCLKNWLDLQPVRHHHEANIDVYIFICYLAYLVLALYRHHFGVDGWKGVKESLEELGRIRKTTIDFGAEQTHKITVLTKEQNEIIKKLGLKKSLFDM